MDNVLDKRGTLRDYIQFPDTETLSRSLDYGFWNQLKVTGNHVLPSCRIKDDWTLSYLYHYMNYHFRRILPFYCTPFYFTNKSERSYCQKSDTKYLWTSFHTCVVSRMWVKDNTMKLFVTYLWVSEVRTFGNEIEETQHGKIIQSCRLSMSWSSIPKSEISLRRSLTGKLII